MDQYRTGKFLAKLRRERGLTQDALGERIGVTGKTISRWETGVYMPDISMLEVLGQEFAVSIDEIIAGEMQTPNNVVTNAENNTSVKRSDTFTLDERIAYFKRKWKRDHMGMIIACAVISAAVIVCGIVFDIGLLAVGGIVSLAAFYIRERGEMMSYVEDRAFYEEKGGDKA